ncbi:MAG: response regulator [Elusimicrobia bacterium]|nr:response regulator [Elusimicrobiota bacterium]
METKGKILVIDDEKEILDVLSIDLEKRGYAVVVAKNGEEGIEKFRKTSFDIIITDMKMPGMSGMTVLTEVKKIDSEVEVIIITAYGTVETVIEGIRKGAFDYVKKPLNIDELLLVVDRALEKRRLKETIALYEISKIIFSTVEIEKLLKIIIDLTMKVLIADDASLMLFDEGGKLYIAASYGLSEEIQKRTRLALGERIAGFVAKDRKPLILIDGLEGDLRFKDIEKRKEIKSSMVLPLIGKSDMFGVLNINRINIKEHFTDTDLHKANIFTSLAILSLENTNLYKKLQLVQQQFVHQSRLASIGEFSASLAHEVGNPLQTILGNADLLLMDTKSGELQSIKDASIRIKKILENLLDFSRQKEIQFSVDDINNLIERTLSLYGKQLELKKIKVVKNYGNLPKITISQSHIGQVIMNLITNAQKAMPKGGTMTITTKEVRCPMSHDKIGIQCPESKVQSSSILDFGPRTSDDFIEISIKDTGSGISKENMNRVFEPFFTTHKDGTGLGLSVCYGIVKKHNGEIAVFSDGEGKGAEFVIKLPIKFLGEIGGGGVKTIR